ncbi:hypothetical protein H5T87_00540 [bacterium]|nr:hypothetical protein [bacterium]
MAQLKKFSTIGWRGISLDVPEDWSVASIGGEEHPEYIRIDDPYGTSYVEIKWWNKPKPTLILEDALDNFLARIQKEATKKKIRLNLKKRKAPPYIERNDRETIVFSWRSDRKGIGRVWYCKTCGKIVMAQVAGITIPPGASHILSTIEDHSSTGKTIWALYNFYMELPEDYKLTDQKLMSGFLQLSFLGPRKQKLKVERYSIAERFLAGYNFYDWARSEFLKRARGFSISISEENFRGHRALIGKGKRRLFGTIPLIGEAMTLFSWHCEQEDKIFLLEARSKKGIINIEEVRQGIRCHSP